MSIIRNNFGKKSFLPKTFQNIGGAVQTGLDAQVKWQAGAGTRLMVTVTLLDIDASMEWGEYSPSQQYGLHFMQQLPQGAEMMLSFYWMSAFTEIGDYEVPANNRLDLHIAKGFRWDGVRGQMALVLENLAGKRNENLGDDLLNYLRDPRIFAQLRLDF